MDISTKTHLCTGASDTECFIVIRCKTVLKIKNFLVYHDDDVLMSGQLFTPLRHGVIIVTIVTFVTMMWPTICHGTMIYGASSFIDGQTFLLAPLSQNRKLNPMKWYYCRAHGPDQVSHSWCLHRKILKLLDTYICQYSFAAFKHFCFTVFNSIAWSKYL